MAATLHKLFEELGLDPKGFEEGLDSAIGRTKKAGEALRKVGLGMSAVMTTPVSEKMNERKSASRPGSHAEAVKTLADGEYIAYCLKESQLFLHALLRKRWPHLR